MQLDAHAVRVGIWVRSCTEPSYSGEYDTMNQTERNIRVAARDADRRERDKQMIMNPDGWPLWPRLPLKRWVYTQRADDFGIMFDSSSEIGGGISLTVHITETGRTITYSDLDALVQDWRID